MGLGGAPPLLLFTVLSYAVGFLPFAFTHVESQPIAAIAPDRGEMAAILDAVTARFDGQGNDDRFISGMSAWHQLADRCQTP